MRSKTVILQIFCVLASSACNLKAKKETNPLAKEAFSENWKDTCHLVTDSLTGLKVYPFPGAPMLREGDFSSLYSLISKELRPHEVNMSEFESTVEFIVDKKGKFVAGRSIKGKTLGRQLLNLFKNLEWKSANCGGKPEAARYIFPIRIHPER